VTVGVICPLLDDGLLKPLISESRLHASCDPFCLQAPPSQFPAPPPSAGAMVPAGPMMQHNYNVYEAVQPHWFYCKQVEAKSVWLPFSFIDSLQLEETYNSGV